MFDFEVGQRVSSLVYGLGVVKERGVSKGHPCYKVEFDRYPGKQILVMEETIVAAPTKEDKENMKELLREWGKANGEDDPAIQDFVSHLTDLIDELKGLEGEDHEDKKPAPKAEPKHQVVNHIPTKKPESTHAVNPLNDEDVAVKPVFGKVRKPFDNVGHHRKLVMGLNELYARKNADYGDSFHDTFVEEGMAMARIRLSDKLNRFKSLTKGDSVQQVNDESVRDTLLDLANYAIMTVIEMDRAAETKEKVA